MYNPKVTLNKAADGGISGTIIGLVSIAVTGWVKSIIDLDAQTEAQISLGIGALTTAILVAAERAVRNWLKHKEM